MRALIALSARAAGLAMLVVLGIAVAAGTVRLLPWIVAPDVPLGLAAPFARILATTAIEASVLLGLPAGLVAAAALLVERGEARALLGLGASPGRLLRPVAALALVPAATAAVVAVAFETEAPGQLSARLVDAGRESCVSRDAPRAIEVPLATVTWLCFPTGPRLVGRVPGLSRDVWFSASGLRPSDDLRRIDLDEVTLGAALSGRIVSIRATRATVAGLPTWGVPGGARGVHRALIVGSSAWLLAVAASWLVLRGGHASAIGATAVTLLAAVTMLAVLRMVDSRAGPWLRAVAVPAAGLAVAAAWLELVRRILWRARGP